MFGEKYLVLREEFIVHQTPTEDWLVDLENQQNYKLTGLDSAMFEMLDGSWSRNGIIKQITGGMEAEVDEIKHIQKAVFDFLELYSFAISEKEEKMQRSQIYYGEKEYYLPNEIGIEMTNKCVLSCLHCYKECSNDKNTYLNYNGSIIFSM